MLARMVHCSLSRNARVSVWTLFALASCAVLVTMFIQASLGLGERMRGALREVGANAVAFPVSRPIEDASPGGARIDWKVLEEQGARCGARSLVLVARVGLVSGKPVAVVAAPPDPPGPDGPAARPDPAAPRDRLAELTPYWSVAGRRPASPGEALAGKHAAEGLGLQTGQDIDVRWGDPPGRDRLRIVGIFESGDDDEDRLFMVPPAVVPPAPVAAPGAARPEHGPGRPYALISVPGGLREVERLAGAVAAAEPRIEVRPLRQVLHGEEVVVEKVRLLSGLSLAVVVALTSLGVSAASMARVLERQKELALLQALGAERRKVLVFLLAEGAALGATASVLGFIIGAVLTFFLMKSIFHLAVPPALAALPAAAAVTIAVALAASLLAARRVLRLAPSVALRGE
jgi:FtsX-like permease family protein